MNVTYVSHACLLIDTGTVLLATDPWFVGPAYCGQWHVFPKPVDPTAVASAAVILLSHGHEDHLHEPTLRWIFNNQRVFYPFYWHQETPHFIRDLGFADVVEARSGSTYPIDRSTAVTFLVNGQDSIMVVEANGQVLVNVNDALHASPAFLIDFYVKKIRRRWPKIDVVFCGFGGASYYPNTVHVPQKDDQVVAKLREQFFLHNFCRIVQGLAPRVAVPFAADFVLLAPHQRWINAVRFPREEIPAYYAKYFASEAPGVTFHVMYPGDRLVSGALQAVSPYRGERRDGKLEHLIDVQYPEEISAFQGADASSAASAGQLAAQLAVHLDKKAKRAVRQRLEGLCFSLCLRDVPDDGWFNVRWTGAAFDVLRAASPAVTAMVKIEMMSKVLTAAITSHWGGDAFVIGYGGDITVADRKNVDKARFCVDLLTGYPRPAAYALRHPIRTLDYLYQSAPAILRRLTHQLGSPVGPVVTKGDMVWGTHWLAGDVRAIRQTCLLPEWHT